MSHTAGPRNLVSLACNGNIAARAGVHATGYDTQPKERYPVLYLQHGGGEDATGWTRQGKANFVLDKLITSGNAKRMIIVMANGYARRAGQTGHGLAGKPFGSPEMRKTIEDMMSAF